MPILAWNGCWSTANDPVCVPKGQWHATVCEREKKHEQKQLFANQVFAMSNIVCEKCPKPEKKIWFQE